MPEFAFYVTSHQTATRQIGCPFKNILLPWGGLKRPARRARSFNRVANCDVPPSVRGLVQVAASDRQSFNRRSNPLFAKNGRRTLMPNHWLADEAGVADVL